MTMSGRRARGFTLIELMVVVTIIAILLAIAVPGYRDQVRKTRRGNAQGCLVEYAQFLERFYTTHLAYDADAAGNAPAPSACSQDVSEFYTLGYDGEPTATTFLLQAEPKGDQEDDVCGTLKLAHTGEKTAARADCW